MWNAFLRHHIQELLTFKTGLGFLAYPVFPPLLTMFLLYFTKFKSLYLLQMWKKMLNNFYMHLFVLIQF